MSSWDPHTWPVPLLPPRAHVCRKLMLGTGPGLKPTHYSMGCRHPKQLTHHTKYKPFTSSWLPKPTAKSEGTSQKPIARKALLHPVLWVLAGQHLSCISSHKAELVPGFLWDNRVCFTRVEKLLASRLIQSPNLTAVLVILHLPQLCVFTDWFESQASALVLKFLSTSRPKSPAISCMCVDIFIFFVHF